MTMDDARKVTPIHPPREHVYPLGGSLDLGGMLWATCPLCSQLHAGGDVYNGAG